MAIVGFVTNSGFLDGKSFDGFRKVLAKEFHASLRVRPARQRSGHLGRPRRQREVRARYSSSGSRAGVAVLLLVKRSRVR